MQVDVQGTAYAEADVNVSGARVHYLHAGSGRPLLLIHGLVGSSFNWRGNIPLLAEGASVYAIDLLNMGQSHRIAGLDAGLEATADQVAAFMDALGLDRADIAAHSHGGAVALMLAARHPQRVRSLVLFAPANPFSDLGDLLIRIYSTSLGRLLARSAPYLPTWMQQIALGRMYGDPARIPQGSLRGYVDGMRIPGTVQHILAIVRGWFADMAKLKAALPRIPAIPTLLVWGDRDRAVDPASAHQLQRLLRHAELRVMHGGGHVLFEELPEQSNRLMLDWLHLEHGSAALPAPVESSFTRPAPDRKRPIPVAARSETSAAM